MRGRGKGPRTQTSSWTRLNRDPDVQKGWEKKPEKKKKRKGSPIDSNIRGEKRRNIKKFACEPG